MQLTTCEIHASFQIVLRFPVASFLKTAATHGIKNDEKRGKLTEATLHEEQT